MKLTVASIYLFGLSALFMGVLTLLRPLQTSDSLNLPHACIGSIYGNGLASFAMGLYYTLAAWQNNRSFFILSVPMRTLSMLVFWNQGGPWKPAAIWEGTGAAITATALLFKI